MERSQLPSRRKPRLSFSGNERNRLFIKGGDGDFHDVSGLSGLDSKSDGRCIAVLDYDNDGFQDFLVANANAPSLSIYRNEMQALGGKRNYVSVKLIGGNDTSQTNSEYSNRDAIGARITVNVAGRKLVQQLSAGEGFAAQNQAERRFGLKDQESVDSITVRWPSGRTQTITEAIASRALITIYEKPKTGQQKCSVVSLEPAKLKADKLPSPSLELSGLEVPTGKMAIVTSMATWCPTCKSHLPELAMLKERYSERIEVFAIAIDKQDTTEKLQEYFQANSPPYELLPDTREASATKFNEFVAAKIGAARLSSTVILGPNAKVLQVLPRVPTVSDIEMLIHDNQ